MNKKIVLYALILILLVLGAAFLTGCYDNFDLESRALCTAMAVDYNGDEGYRVILSLPALENEEELGRNLKEETAPTLSEAIAKIDAKSTKRLYFGHMQTVITGMGLLRSEKALRELTSYLTANVQIDKNILLAGAYNIEELMDAEPKEDKLTGFFISGYYDNGKDEKTFVNKETLLAYLKDEAEAKTAVIPVLALENGEPAFLSAAILKDNSLAGILDSREANGFMWLTGNASGTALSRGEPAVTTEITENNTEYDFYEENGQLKLNISINAVGNMWNFSEREIVENSSEYLESFKAEIEEQTAAALEELKKMDCDALSLSSILEKNNKELYLKHSDNPLPVQTDVSVNLSLNFV